MKKFLILSFILASQTFSHSQEKQKFFCDYLGTPLMDKGNHPNQYFDRLFLYEELKGKTRARFPLHNIEPFELKLKKGILYGHIIDFKGKRREGFYKEIYHVYQMNPKTGYLVRSHIFYLHPEDKKQNYNAQALPYAPPRIERPIQFLDVPVPKGYTFVAWDGASWQCRKVGSFKYLLHSVGEVFKQILGV